MAVFFIYKPPTPTPPPVVVSSSKLAEVVDNALIGTYGTYGIVVKNLKTQESYFKNAHRVFAPASLYKLWIMGVVFKQIQNGRLSEDEVLTAQVADLNKKFEISDADAEAIDGVVSFSVRDALDQMITISDNYAALLLTDKIGLETVSLYLQENGFFESKVGAGGESPTTTPQDTALFLEKLYSGQLANQQYTTGMLDLLRGQKLNDGLPKYLPYGVTVAHKTGAMDINTHDAGITYTAIGDYIIVVFSESDSREQAQERIAAVSQAVYGYFSSH